ncbi:MAG: hypothetical protein EAY75_00815 [Bacteroidetes bacterium]|nr:MAG: hypothetical protein EAY75_00815 [Bacteroidota bacterium]
MALLGPANCVHVPKPTVTGMAFMMTLFAPQVLMSAPALATVGTSKRLIVMILSEFAQIPFDTVHLNMLSPTERFVTPVILELGELIAPVPLTTVH